MARERRNSKSLQILRRISNASLSDLDNNSEQDNSTSPRLTSPSFLNNDFEMPAKFTDRVEQEKAQQYFQSFQIEDVKSLNRDKIPARINMNLSKIETFMSKPYQGFKDGVEEFKQLKEQITSLIKPSEKASSGTPSASPVSGLLIRGLVDDLADCLKLQITAKLEFEQTILSKNQSYYGQNLDQTKESAITTARELANALGGRPAVNVLDAKLSNNKDIPEQLTSKSASPYPSSMAL